MNELKRKHGAGYSLLVEPLNNDCTEMNSLAELIHSFMDSLTDDEVAIVDTERKKFFTTRHHRHGPDHFLFRIPSEIQNKFKEMFTELD